jgi:hypothetical protein
LIFLKHYFLVFGYSYNDSILHAVIEELLNGQRIPWLPVVVDEEKLHFGAFHNCVDLLTTLANDPAPGHVLASVYLNQCCFNELGVVTQGH